MPSVSVLLIVLSEDSIDAKVWMANSKHLPRNFFSLMKGSKREAERVRKRVSCCLLL